MAAASFSLFAESRYTYDPAKDIVIGSVSLSLSAASLFINHAENNAARDDVPLKDSVNAFDRGLMTDYNTPLSITGDAAVYGILALPLLSLAGKDGNTWLTYSVMYAESALLVFGTTEVFKRSVLRYRPYCYYGEIPLEKTDYYKSFPSRHTAFAFMSAGFFVSTFSAEYPDSPWKLPLGAAVYTLAAGIGVSRIFSGNHFLSDVLAGAAAGSLWGLLVPRLHLRKNSGSVRLAPLPGGLVLAYTF